MSVEAIECFASTARLTRITGFLEERCPCSVMLEFRTDDGRDVVLTIADLLAALTVIEAEGEVPPLPFGWMSRTKEAYGISVQTNEKHEPILRGGT